MLHGCVTSMWDLNKKIQLFITKSGSWESTDFLPLSPTSFYCKTSLPLAPDVVLMPAEVELLAFARIPQLPQSPPDFIQNGRIVDGRGHLELCAVGDLDHGGAQDFAGAGFGQAVDDAA